VWLPTSKNQADVDACCVLCVLAFHWDSLSPSSLSSSPPFTEKIPEESLNSMINKYDNKNISPYSIHAMSGMLPNNISSAGVSASEIPDGFSLAGPNNSSGGGGGGGPSDTAAEQAKQRQAQREAILEQAMTPDALARLRRVKVSILWIRSYVID
jgi:hypothetical protein